jgi:azurin
MKTKFIQTTIAAACVFMLYACSSGSLTSDEETKSETTAESIPNPTEITIRGVGNTMAEMSYDIDNITIDAGKDITITLINDGIDEAMKHNVVIIYNGYAEEVATKGMKHPENNYVQPQDPAVLASSPMSGPGETVTFTFSIDKPGTYQYVCTYPGHWSKMMGFLTVE